MCNDVFTLLFFSFLTKICNNKITQCICDRRQTQWKCRLQSNGWNTQQHEIHLIFFSTEKGLVEFRVWWSLVVSADLNSVFVVHFIGESFTQFINRFDGRWNGFSKTRNRDFFFSFIFTHQIAKLPQFHCVASCRTCQTQFENCTTSTSTVARHNFVLCIVRERRMTSSAQNVMRFDIFGSFIMHGIFRVSFLFIIHLSLSHFVLYFYFFRFHFRSIFTRRTRRFSQNSWLHRTSNSRFQRCRFEERADNSRTCCRSQANCQACRSSSSNCSQSHFAARIANR